MGGVRMDLRSVDREHPDLHQPRLLAQPQHRAEQLSQRVLVAGTKPRDRRVIGLLLSGDYPVGDILHTLVLDHPRGALTPRIGVEQKRDHLGSTGCRYAVWRMTVKARADDRRLPGVGAVRSEEHTSELQSLRHLV